MRPSKRDDILEAALRVVEQSGVQALTFDSVAEAAGLTKGGLQYHFQSKEIMLHALHDHLAQQWEADLESAAGGRATDLTPDERLVAYTKATSKSASRAELLLMLEAVTHPELNVSGAAVMSRWTADIPEQPGMTPGQVAQHIARLATDGLWLLEAMTGKSINPDVHQELVEGILKLIGPDAGN